MKRSTWMRLIAVILIISMLAAPVSAASIRGYDSVQPNGMVGLIIGFIRLIEDIIEDLFDDWFDKPGDETPAPTQPDEPTTPTTPAEPDPSAPSETEPGETQPGEPKPGVTEPGETEPGETEPGEEAPETELNLIEGYENTENGQLLRAATYSLSQEPQVSTKPLRASSSSIFGRKTGLNAGSGLSLNALTRVPGNTAEVNATETVISDTPVAVTFDENGKAEIPNGDYLIRYADATYGNYLLATASAGSPWGTTTLKGTRDQSAAGIFTFTRQADGTYTIQTADGKYLDIPANNQGNLTTAVNYIDITDNTDNPGGLKLKDMNSNKSLNALGVANYHPNNYYHGGWNTGSPYELYRVIVEEPVNLEVGGSATFTDETGYYVGADVSALNTAVATVTLSGEQASTGYALSEKITAIESGKTYVFYNKVAQKLMSNQSASASGGAGGSTGLALSSAMDAFTENDFWTVTAVDGGYHVQDQNDKYLTVARGSAGVQDDPVVLAVAYDGTDWTIGQHTDGTNYEYLNDFGGTHTAVAGWNNINDVNSQWEIYEVTPSTNPGSTSITFRGVGAGQTSVRIGDVIYNITVTGSSSNNVVYFPVTMYNYDADTYRTATQLLEMTTAPKTDWEGLYFSGGNPTDADSKTLIYTTSSGAHTDLTWEAVLNGTYYTDEACTNRARVNPFSADGSSGYTPFTVTRATIRNSADANGATPYYYLVDGTYHPVYYSSTFSVYWMNEGALDQIEFGNGQDSDTIELYMNNVAGYTLTDASGAVLATLDSTDTSAPVGVTLYSAGETQDVVKNFARWNFWSYQASQNSAQNKFYTGLVQDTLLDDQIKFNVVEGGIFNDDHQIKDIYEFVGLPFVLDENGVYHFNSDENGVYFRDTDGNGSADPASGTAQNPYNLYFDKGNTQGWSGMVYGDGSTNLWAPFNTNANDTAERNIDYHFGMRADLPFSMTPNGRIKSTDDESAPITFTFQGDDDVWIFVDGHLVIDLGGIHNRLGAEVNFAENTITYFLPESNNRDLPIGSYNTAEDYPLNDQGKIVKKLFTDADGTGIIPMTIDAFAADIDHEMSIFYLERGMGTSNSAISFNLPMKDEVIITKDADTSWSEQQDDADGENGDGTAPLTKKEQEAVNNINFGFTLYKKEANGEYAPVANTNFYRDGTGAALSPINSTDKNGHFYLKNGESARFITEIPANGVTYYVVEDTVPEGFLTPDYNFAGIATGGYQYTGYTLGEDGTTSVFVPKAEEKIPDASMIPEQELPLDATENKSYEVTVYGSIESTDTIEFICVNYLDAELPNPSALANEDIIVIDYGLPVDIDPLINDVFRGDDIEIVAWGDESLVLNEVVDEFGNAIDAQTTWTGTQNLHSGVLEFNGVTYSDDEHDTFTYTLTKPLTEVEVISYIIKVTSTVDNIVDDQNMGPKTASRYALAKVYIVPATIMYYEENFSDWITFTDNSKTGNTWGGTETNTEFISDRQEPGVVGTVHDSTYGSDVAYLNDSGDSNGTSRFGNTTNGALQFSYTFTGTGTSIFARTSDKTGYMQIKIYEGESATGEYAYIDYRDTYWKDENNTDLDISGILYNIPVYTHNLPYGTYTVVCTVAKAGTPTEGNTEGSGNVFYLDGIRIMQPLNLDSERADLTEKALGAYATDGEANLDVVTLREKMITDAEDGVVTWDGTNFVVMTDVNGEILTADTYESIGPKEEVYLAPGQKVSFSLKYWEPEGLKLYMGMKAPFGTGPLKIGQSSYALNNTVDCYYDVTNNNASLVTKEEQGVDAEGNLLYEDGNGNVYYLQGDTYYDYDNPDVTHTGEGLVPHMVSYFVVTYTFEATENIVSLTNIKVVGSHEFTIVEDTDITVPGEEEV